MARLSSTRKKILSPNKAAAWVKRLQKQGKKVVFTNGCFDLLHSGHVTYLEQARNLGDALVVALNGDESVRQLKGPGRPLVTLEDRAKVIAALSAVDCVTWFNESVPVKLVGKLQTKIYVKGGDYDITTIPEYEVVTGYGGKALALSFVKGRSTTNLIKKARKQK